MWEWKEGNVLFNDALNTFYLRLYGVRHMVKDYTDSERENLLPPHGILFPISSKGSFICTIPQTYHSLWNTSRGALAGTRNSYVGMDEFILLHWKRGCQKSPRNIVLYQMNVDVVAAHYRKQSFHEIVAPVNILICI